MHAITDVIKGAGAVAHIGQDRVPNEICRAALLPADVIRDTS